MAVFLVGPMGAGKTAIGRELARGLGWPFHDTDAEVQERSGADVGFIFEREGEAGFRARERRVVHEFSRLGDAVVATGGGVVLDPENREDLKAGGTVVYLYASVPHQLSRTRAGRHRPLLDTADPAARLAALFVERDPLYREVAHHVVMTDGRRVKSVANEILGLLT